MNDTLKKTPLHDVHLGLRAKMVPFAEYEMPVQYPTGITAEHQAVRAGAGLFDVSHMGEFLVHGPQAIDLVQLVSVNDAASLAVQLRQAAERHVFVDDGGRERIADGTPPSSLTEISTTVFSATPRALQVKEASPLESTNPPSEVTHETAPLGSLDKEITAPSCATVETKSVTLKVVEKDSPSVTICRRRSASGAPPVRAPTARSTR